MSEVSSTPIQDVYPGLKPGPLEITVHPKSTRVEDAVRDDSKHKELQRSIDEHKGSFADNMRTMGVEHENAMLAGSQQTTPIVAQHKPNVLGPATENEDGTISYKNEEGKNVPTNTKEHVILKDPEDGGYKVYKRSDDTDVKGEITGRLVGLGRFVNQGFATTPAPIQSALTEGAKVIQAADALKDATGVGVAVPKIATTENPITQTVGRTVSHIPGGSTKFAEAAENMRSGLGQAADAASTAATKVGANPEVAGEFIRDDLKAAVQGTKGERGTLDQKVGEYYDKVDKYVKPGITGELTNTKNIVNKINADLAEAGIKDPSKAVAQVENSLGVKGGLTYAGLKTLRTRIGEMIGRGALPEGVQMGELKKIYGALTEDLKGVITKSGSRAAGAWDKANKFAEVTARQKEQLGKILGTETRSDEATFAAITRAAGSKTTADAKLLALAKRTVSPEAWDALASGTVRQLGWRGNGADRAFDPSKFIKDYGGLSDRGKNLLFGQGGKLRTALDKIAELSNKYPEATEFAHPSGELGHIVAAAGILHKVKEALSVFSGAGVVSRLLSKPATASSTAKFMQRYQELRAKPTPATLVAFNQSAKLLSSDAAKEFDEGLEGTASIAGGIALKIFSALTGAFLSQGKQ